jgi:hypothetical protein
MNLSFLSTLRSYLNRLAPWLLLGVISACILIGMSGELLPSSSRMPPSHLLRLDAPATIAFDHNQAPIFAVYVTNTSTAAVEDCAISGWIEHGSWPTRYAEVFSLSPRFRVASGTRQLIQVTVPPGGIPARHTKHDLQLTVNCASFTRVEQTPHVALSMD